MKLPLFAAGLGLLLSCAGVRAADLAVGDKAPDFALPGSDGKTHKLSDYKGRTVVLAWFPKAFTGGWTKECKSLRESGAAIRQFDAAYFAASVDEPQKNKEFAESLSADYAILSDPGKQTAEAYGVVMPMVGFAKRWTFYVGPDGKIQYIDKEVKVDSAGADIAARLAALGTKKAQ
jgi:thioredoxin-dependent peroxiredoxin